MLLGTLTSRYTCNIYPPPQHHQLPQTSFDGIQNTIDIGSEYDSLVATWSGRTMVFGGVLFINNKLFVSNLLNQLRELSTHG